MLSSSLFQNQAFGSFTSTFNAEPFQWSALEDSSSDEKVDPATPEKAGESIKFSICIRPFSSAWRHRKKHMVIGCLELQCLDLNDSLSFFFRLCRSL